mmetsp:Transcript_13444/g.40654  ORF Transcript_13444/g.40654 Transcript_13444/m.40654 type:complete len:156 (-) Transcript_13444:208-675(-)
MLRPASPTSTAESDDDVGDEDPLFGGKRHHHRRQDSSDSSDSSSDLFASEDDQEETKAEEGDDLYNDSKLDRLVERIESRREAQPEAIELTTLDDVDSAPNDPDTEDDDDAQPGFREDALFLELRRSQIRQSHQAWVPPPGKPPPREKCRVFACW